MTKAIIKSLRGLKACHSAIEWAEKFDSDQAAWDACERADWMLWIATRLSGKRGSEEHRRVVLAACACARMALKHSPTKKKRPLKAILLAERYGRGEDIGLDDLRTAAYAAYANAAAAAYVANVAAATYATNTAYAAIAAANANAAYTIAFGNEKTKALADMAKVIRKIIPKAPKE